MRGGRVRRWRRGAAQKAGREQVEKRSWTDRAGLGQTAWVSRSTSCSMRTVRSKRAEAFLRRVSNVEDSLRILFKEGTVEG